MDFFKLLFEDNNLYMGSFFDRFTDEIYFYDKDMRLQYVNKMAEKVDNYDLETDLGKSFFDLYKDIPEEDSPILYTLKTERPVYNYIMTYQYNGKQRTALINTGPVYQDGELVGAYSIAHDYTAVDATIKENISLKNLLNSSQTNSGNKTDNNLPEIVGKCQSIQKCKKLLTQAAKNDSSILLVGDTGTGKELFAKAIHNNSARKNKSFLALNCASIPENLIESILFGTTKGAFTGSLEKDGLLYQADGGTIFLDELNSMPLSSQAKLLRFLEDRKIMKLGGNKEIPINVRIISSINESPESAIRNKHLREDLFYRLSVVQIQIPTLKERQEDISDLIHFFINDYNKKFNKHVTGITATALERILNYSWPGNVRQLKACIESALNFTDIGNIIDLQHLPQYLMGTTETLENIKNTSFKELKTYHSDFNKTKESINDLNLIKQSNEIHERNLILNALQECGGNISKAANLLGISRQLLNYRIKKYNLR